MHSYGQGINASGQVTGWAETLDGAWHAFLYSGTMTDLRPIGFGSSYGFSINDSGWITGSIDIENVGYHAFLYNPDTHVMTDFTPGAITGQGRGINASGWVTGYTGPVETPHAFLYRGGTMLDLGVVGDGTYSQGSGINASGQITGWGDTSSAPLHAFLYGGGPGLVDLDPAGTFSQGIAINACGQIAGAFNGNAFLYSADKGMVNLNGLIPSDSDWVLADATAINDGGQITGYGYHNGAEHAFLLNPVVSQGAFVCAASMRSPRFEHTATLLSGGNTVLVTGGSSGGSLDSAEIYNSTAGAFSFTVGPMLSPRYAHTATLLDNGRVLIAGGYDSHLNTYLSSAELYDSYDNLFLPTGAMISARQYHTATLLNNGKVLIAGGLNATSFLSAAELYDPATGNFTATSTSMSSPRYGHTATLLSDGRVLIAGGCTSNSPDCIASAELYDPNTDTFSLTGSMLQSRAWHTATLLNDGKVLIAGGNQGNADYTAELYDPATGTFSATGPMVSTFGAVYHTATILLDGSVLITGGDWGAGATDQAQLYDPLTGNFSLVAGSMSSRRYRHTATRLGNGQVLITGGANDVGTVLGSADLYRAPESLTQPLSPAGGTASFIFDDDVYNIAFQYPAGYVPDNSYSLTVTPIQTSQADWALRTPLGNPYAGTQLAPVTGLGGDGIIYRAVCADTLGNPCPPPPTDLSYTTITSWDGPAGNNPGFLKAPIGSNDWENVLISYTPSRVDPTGAGKSRGGFSDWAFVYDVTGTAPSIQITTPADGATYTLNQLVNANYACTGNSVMDCVGSVANGSAIDTSSLGSKTFTVNATVSAGLSAVQTVTYNVVEACHYAWFTLNPSSVPQGGSTKVTANLQSCSNVSQKVALQFTWTVPSPGSCQNSTKVVFTTPTFQLKPKTSITFTFPLWIPNRVCTGNYTVSATTLISGKAVDTTSTSLTVTSK